MNEYDIHIGCIYLEGKNSDQFVDFYLEDIREQAKNTFGIVFYEWNIFHHGYDITSHTYYDLDGVIGIDPPDERNTEEYISYIKNAEPFIIPSTKVGAIVTYRLEKYRDITSGWLKNQGVEYGKLIMSNVGSYDERTNWKSPSTYKGEIYRDSNDAYLFIESNDTQAKEICMISGKCVYSVEGNCMYNLIDGKLYKFD